MQICRFADLLIKNIADRAQGVFLWVFLVTKLLREGLTNDDTLSDLRKMLDSIHPDLEQFFRHILDGVSGVYHEKMAGYLEIALAAHEPLDVFIYHFHEMEYDDVDFALKERIGAYSLPDAVMARDRLRRRLDAFCKGLLEVDAQHRVQYIHRTVKDWLGTAAMRSYLEGKIKPGFKADLSILRAYLAWYKHPLVGSQVEIKLEDLIVNWSGWIVDKLVEAVPYTYITDASGQYLNTGEVYRILDAFYSVTIELFEACWSHLRVRAKPYPRRIVQQCFEATFYSSHHGAISRARSKRLPIISCRWSDVPQPFGFEFWQETMPRRAKVISVRGLRWQRRY